MKAIVIAQHGGVGVLEYRDVPEPVANRRDVIIKIDSCGICFHDILIRNGTLRKSVTLPLIPGHEISGTVVDVGPDVKDFKAGDRVATTQRYHICGQCSHCRTGREPLCPEGLWTGNGGLVGGYAQYVAIEDDNIAMVPDNVPLDQASITACTVGTLLNAMRDVGSVTVGESVLITGAGGGLGTHAIQLARLQGAFVIAQTSSPDKVDMLHDLGAHEVVLHEREADFSPEIRRITKGRGVDVVVDNVGTLLFQPIRRSLALSGRWIMVGQLTGDFAPFNPAHMIFKGINMLSASSTTRLQLEQSLELVSRGQIRPIIADRIPLNEASHAHEIVEKGAAGRIILKPAE